MDIKLKRLKAHGIMAAWYYIEEGQTSTIGNVTKKNGNPISAMSKELTDVGFVHRGKIHIENDMADLYMDPSHDLPKRNGMPVWANATPVDGDGVIFCMATYNPKHVVTDIHRWRDLSKGESFDARMIGFMCVVEGNVTINDTAVSEGDIVKLSGKDIHVVATENNVTVAALQIEAHDPSVV